jgi:hypothetical protein
METSLGNITSSHLKKKNRKRKERPGMVMYTVGIPAINRRWKSEGSRLAEKKFSKTLSQLTS